MTPDERFERIETQLELLARYSAETADRLDSVTERLGRLTARVEGLAEVQSATSQDVARLVDAVASLVRLFERHTGDGHGGKA